MNPPAHILGPTAAVIIFAAALSYAQAQATFPTPQISNNAAVNAPGTVNMCWDTSSNTAFPCSPLVPLSVWIRGGNPAITPYPTGATPITGNATGTTGAVVGTLTAAATGRVAYICGLNVSALGGTATVGPITVAGLLGSSMVFQLASTATGTNFTVPFTPCVPASGINTNITITTTSDGSATAVDVNSWGFLQ